MTLTKENIERIKLGDYIRCLYSGGYEEEGTVVKNDSTGLTIRNSEGYSSNIPSPKDNQSITVIWPEKYPERTHGAP